MVFLPSVDGHTIGDNEEIPIMVKALQKEPDAEFTPNAAGNVPSSFQTGIGVNAQAKFERKITVGKVYMQKLYEESGSEDDYDAWSARMWDALKVITQQDKT